MRSVKSRFKIFKIRRGRESHIEQLFGFHKENTIEIFFRKAYNAWYLHTERNGLGKYIVFYQSPLTKNIYKSPNYTIEEISTYTKGKRKNKSTIC